MRVVNVDGTRTVLAEATSRGALVVHVSTVAALGPTGEEACAESHWSGTTPRSAYEATKREAHVLAREAAKAGARVRIALPATILGPGDPSLTGRVHRIAARGLLRVGARPRMRLACVHVDDCAEGVIAVAERGQDGEEYVLAEASPTLRAWFTAFARAAGQRPPRVYVPDALLDAVAAVAGRLPMPPLLREAAAMSSGAHWTFTGDKARRELGWSPRPFEDTLRDVAAALR
jgi:dihydroflavonol-4-reductase